MKQNYKKFYRQIFLERALEDEEGALYVIPEDDPNQRIYESQITTWNFSHKLGKNVAPHLKYDPDNVRIVTAGFHGGEHSSGEFHNYLNLR